MREHSISRRRPTAAPFRPAIPVQFLPDLRIANQRATIRDILAGLSPQATPTAKASDDTRELSAHRREGNGLVPVPGISQVSAAPYLQAKLEIGAVDDPREREADRIADQVMRMPSPAPAQRARGTLLQRKCEACAEEKRLARKGGGAAVQHEAVAPAIVHETLASPGQPLDAAARAFLEPRFGRDFGHVRVHTVGRAATSARAIDALAYTVGHHIVFGPGQYAPDTPDGAGLLAHELTHVIQQSDAAGSGQGGKVMRQVPTQRPTATMLRPCNPGKYTTFTSAVDLARKMINDAVRGLQGVLSSWGKEPRSVDELSTSNALAKGFNIAFDKTIWVSLLGFDPAEVAAQDARDRAVVPIILANFQQIQTDIANYANPPACQREMRSGSTCVGCVDGQHPRCQASVIAWVPPEFLGRPSSPMLLCPDFFDLSPSERAGTVIHELAHLQTFAATDFSGATRYYGCPVEPLEPLAPGLSDPRAFIRIADSYRCFAITQANTASAFAKLGVGTSAAPSSQLPSPGPTTPSP